MAVEAVELVVTALTAGAAAGMKDTATAAVKDAYAGLQNGIRRLLARDDSPGEASLLEAYAANPDEHRDELVAALTSADTASDPEVLSAARALLAELGARDERPAKFTVRVTDSQGVQVGDGNTMHVKF
ncbi:hypothetical protein [Amycolatopsis sp. NPDC049159]|uniref:hypothetical protein n=1 Tax=Amycolatopsis sp. NPDC049159 TaxID=3157210 RepID=UPI0033D0797B